VGEQILPTGCNPPSWTGKVWLRGDLGYSLQNGAPVASVMMRRVGNSVILAAISFVLIMPISLLMGYWPA